MCAVPRRPPAAAPPVVGAVPAAAAAAAAAGRQLQRGRRPSRCRGCVDRSCSVRLCGAVGAGSPDGVGSGRRCALLPGRAGTGDQPCRWQTAENVVGLDARLGRLPAEAARGVRQLSAEVCALLGCECGGSGDKNGPGGRGGAWCSDRCQTEELGHCRLPGGRSAEWHRRAEAESRCPGAGLLSSPALPRPAEGDGGHPQRLQSAETSGGSCGRPQSFRVSAAGDLSDPGDLGDQEARLGTIAADEPVPSITVGDDGS